MKYSNYDVNDKHLINILKKTRYNIYIENGVLLEYNGNDEKVIVSNGVTKIDEDAFFWCENLKLENHAPLLVHLMIEKDIFSLRQGFQVVFNDGKQIDFKDLCEMIDNDEGLKISLINEINDKEKSRKTHMQALW